LVGTIATGKKGLILISEDKKYAAFVLLVGGRRGRNTCRRPASGVNTGA